MFKLEVVLASRLLLHVIMCRQSYVLTTLEALCMSIQIYNPNSPIGLISLNPAHTTPQWTVTFHLMEAEAMRSYFSFHQGSICKLTALPPSSLTTMHCITLFRSSLLRWVQLLWHQQVSPKHSWMNGNAKPSFPRQKLRLIALNLNPRNLRCKVPFSKTLPVRSMIHHLKWFRNQSWPSIPFKILPKLCKILACSRAVILVSLFQGIRRRYSTVWGVLHRVLKYLKTMTKSCSKLSVQAVRQLAKVLSHAKILLLTAKPEWKRCSLT